MCNIVHISICNHYIFQTTLVISSWLEFSFDNKFLWINTTVNAKTLLHKYDDATLVIRNYWLSSFDFSIANQLTIRNIANEVPYETCWSRSFIVENTKLATYLKVPRVCNLNILLFSAIVNFLDYTKNSISLTTVEGIHTTR